MAGILFVLLLALVPSLASCLCECGYSAEVHGRDRPVVFMDVMETDFTHVRDISMNSDWVRQQFNVSSVAGRGKYGKAFLLTHVVTRPVKKATAGAGLELTVGTVMENGAVPGAEIDTKRLDLHWGSYRAGMKLTAVNGTCASFFWYFNDTQEIDVEFLSKEFDRENEVYPVNLVVQSRESQEAGHDASKTSTFQRVNLTFDPTVAFHEYRFDYLPGHVLFYADSEPIARMEGGDMPSTGGHLILQHWSNGNPKWAAGPPEQDAVLSVSYVKAYFNSSDSQRHMHSTSLCHDASADGAICAIPDVIAANASTGGSFFIDKGSSADGSEDEDEGSMAGSLGASMAVVMAAMFIQYKVLGALA